MTPVQKLWTVRLEKHRLDRPAEMCAWVPYRNPYEKHPDYQARPVPVNELSAEDRAIVARFYGCLPGDVGRLPGGRTVQVEAWLPGVCVRVSEVNVDGSRIGRHFVCGALDLTIIRKGGTE